jgi:hypothetical protein
MLKYTPCLQSTTIVDFSKTLISIQLAEQTPFIHDGDKKSEETMT